MSGVVNGRAAKETRPINVKYPFIMKINDKNCDDYHISEVSSVVGWLPQKNSSKLELWKLSNSLNDYGAFISGGPLKSAGELELDSMRDHLHRDLGHVHNDIGHVHEDQGHSHEMESMNGETITYDVLRPGTIWGDGDGGPHFGMVVDRWTL